MRSVKTENSVTEHRLMDEAGNHDPERSLWTYYEDFYDESLGEARAIVSVWVPSLEEREAIAAGANIRLISFSQRTPPVTMDVSTEKIIGPNV
jgi:hypothetical protein